MRLLIMGGCACLCGSACGMEPSRVDSQRQSKRLEEVTKGIAAMLWVADRDPRHPQSGNVRGFLATRYS